MSHDADLVAKVAEALWERDRCPKSWAGNETCYVHGANWSESGQWCEAVERWARAVLDALDVPGLIRAAKAEALTEAADDMERIFCAGNLLGGPTDDWLRNRAAEIDPEEGDDGRV